MSQRISTRSVLQSIITVIIGMSLSLTGFAQGVLEEVIVTAQKREQNVQDVPISISTLSGERLESRFSGGESILALAGAAPGLYAESSNGRHSPRFYMRGLGNADFDQAASQPVSIVFDEVPMELVVLKAFPVFDIDHVEVIRGPQGTLFGRNTTAGIVKFDSRKPTEETEGYMKISGGNLGSINAEAAIGGTLIEGKLMARASFLTQNRSDWIDNTFTGENDAIGGHNEYAGRIQLLWTPTDNFSALIMHQRRDLSGNSASAFRANILTTGSNVLNTNYSRDKVSYDGGGNNPAEIDANGTNLKLDWDVGNYTITSITSYQDAEQFARGDIDGGFGFGFAGTPTGPGFIPFPSDTGGNNFIEQLTQEIRIASNLDGNFNYQFGAFYFDDELSTSTEFGLSPTPKDTSVGSIAFQENTSWAIFFQGDYDISDQLVLTAGVRYSDDEKDYTETTTDADIAANFFRAPDAEREDPVNLSDTNVSWNVSLSYAIDDDSQVYTRIASGFRAPSIQARNVAFGGMPSTANSETIMSYEIGYKTDINDRIRFNTAAFYYDIDDMQLTAIGGAGNFTTLLNAKSAEGYGIEFDIDWALSEDLILSGGFGYNKTKIKEAGLAVAPCGFGNCTVTDPFDADGNAIIDGNPFQHAPEWTLNVELSYTYPMSNDADLFFYTDWKVKGETNEFLYESIEFNFGTQFEGGLKAGYRDNTRNFEVAFFARNITDEDNPIGGIDFNNLTSYVNEPRVWGVEGTYRF